MQLNQLDFLCLCITGLYRFFTKIMSIKKDSITMITITITKFTSLLNGDFGH